MNMRTSLSILLSLCAFCLFAQAPASNIYVFDMNISRTTDYYSFTQPRLITGNNLAGYDNQPMFIDGSLYITSQRDEQQTDIYKFDLAEKKQTRITGTLESEYSPKKTFEEGVISVVRVSADSNQTQQLWKLPAEGGKAELVAEDVEGVGYYEWLNRKVVAMFIVGEPHTLILVNSTTGDTRKVRSNIGRCLQRTPSGSLAFVHKDDSEGWYIKVVNPGNFTIRPVVATLPDCEDFYWSEDNVLYMANKSKLYRFKLGMDDEWTEVADFSEYGLNNITRLAVSKKQVVLVNVSDEK